MKHRESRIERHSRLWEMEYAWGTDDDQDREEGNICKQNDLNARQRHSMLQQPIREANILVGEKKTLHIWGWGMT